MFVFAYRDASGANRVTADSQRRYFLPRVNIENYSNEINGRNFYDQPINDRTENLLNFEENVSKLYLLEKILKVFSDVKHNPN